MALCPWMEERMDGVRSEIEIMIFNSYFKSRFMPSHSLFLPYAVNDSAVLPDATYVAQKKEATRTK